MTTPSPSIQTPATGHPPHAPFYARAAAYLEEMLRLNLYVATYLGYHRYDALMDDFSLNGVADRVSFVEGMCPNPAGLLPY